MIGMCSVTACVTADLLPRKNVTQSERYLCISIGHMCSVTAGVTADLLPRKIVTQRERCLCSSIEHNLNLGLQEIGTSNQDKKIHCGVQGC